MSTLFLNWHLGLGDAVLCNGLVRELAKRYDKLFLPVKHDKVVSVFWMFSDLANVNIVPVKDDDEANGLRASQPSLGLGIWSKRGLWNHKHWDQQFYQDANVPFQCRWDSFHIPSCPQVKPPEQPYAFVHEEPSRGYAMTRLSTSLTIYRPPKPPHLFWNIDSILQAHELHLVNSCFLCLADSFPLRGKLVVHNYARTDVGPPTLKNQWEIIE